MDHDVRPRPRSEPEAKQPGRFARAVGLAFAAVGVVGFATGATLAGAVATAAAPGAASVNAATGLCPGCELHPHFTRMTNREEATA